MPSPASLRGPLLAFETSGPIARVALVDPAGVRLAGGQRAGERHSDSLLPLCDEVLSGARVTASALGAIACGAGPGSFTGLRVGLAVAKGLALPWDLPVVLISSLRALAEDLAPLGGAELAPCIDAGKGEVYGQLHGRAGPDQPLLARGPEQRLTPDAYARQCAERAGVVVGGTGLDRHEAVFRQLAGAAALHPGFPGPTAEAVARLALARLARGERDDLAAAVPSYGRSPDITTAKRVPPR
jgi:tRNA threonylcarbamoyladenosine biosynthesis protein TsaB